MVLVFTLACVKKVLRRWQLIPSLSCCFAISASSLKLLSVGDKLKAADGGTKHLWIILFIRFDVVHDESSLQDVR